MQKVLGLLPLVSLSLISFFHSNVGVGAILEEETETSKELLMEVKVKRSALKKSASTSSTEIDQAMIRHLPQGSEVSLPKLISATTPGVVEGAFGQLFVRGNHGNIQYQIDGVPMPESPAGMFGQVFSPRNIDHFEIITGGIPAEYGQRLGAVMNITTKAGPEKPAGEVELNYGGYNTTSPHILYGGSNENGNFHYYFGLNYRYTERGIDTPQPRDSADLTQGGGDSVHNTAKGDNEFAKLDWQLDNSNKLALVLFNAYTDYQIPNYPSSFGPTDPLFSPNYSNEYASGDGHEPAFIYVPWNTDDTQSERNSYAQLIWKHTFADRSYLQIAPFYKYSQIAVTNDPANDLAALTLKDSSGNLLIPHSDSSSFAQNRHVNNIGMKSDYTFRPHEDHLVKTGVFFQASQSSGFISVQAHPDDAPYVNSDPSTGFFEGVYIQDDYTISKDLVLNVGLRYDATQFQFSDTKPSDSLLQPRVGLNYLLTETTQLHAFYGKLFQPVGLENFRSTFARINNDYDGAPYDIKAQKDDYYEIGVRQNLPIQHMLTVNFYYRDSINVVDHAQLLRTSIAQPFNFAKGYAYGVETSIQGEISSNWSDYASYSYSIAKGQGISGGAWVGEAPTSPGYQFLDHTQIHTANSGIMYSRDGFWWSAQGVFGSGLRTGENNSINLPSHFTMDTTLGYELTKLKGFPPARISGDIVNIFDNRYPITISNGFNGSRYSNGRMIYVRLTLYI